MSTVRLVLRLAAFAAVVALLVPLQWLVLAVTRGPASLVLPRLFHRLLCRVLGLRVQVDGAPAQTGQVVFIANHLSHLDVLVIGSVLPGCCFVAKDDIRDWPLLGALARLQQTVFVSRKPGDAAAAGARLADALDAGHRLVLFPEGTTSDGREVLPFKSSLFAPLAHPALAHVALQPMTLALEAVHGRTLLDGGDRDAYAYYGDMRLGPHLLAFMRGTGASVRLTLHPPLPRDPTQSRKTQALLAHASVRGPIAGAAATAAWTGPPGSRGPQFEGG